MLVNINANNYADFKAIANTAGALNGVFVTPTQVWAYSRASGDSILVTLNASTPFATVQGDFASAIQLSDNTVFS